MADISVNGYVRTKDGRIGKIISKKPVYENDKLDYYLYLTSLNEFIYAETQIKECGWRIGKNLIDLIEVGDYVNGKRVIQKWEEPDWREYFIKLDGEETVPTMRNIESIVTHEQFENIKYIVKEKEE